MKLNDVVLEAASPAQQAAIAIAKKKKAGMVKEQQLDEFAPLLAAGARLFMAAAPKIAQVLGRAGQAGARGAGQAARAGTEIAAKNAGKIGMGAGAYEIGSSVADIAKDIAAKVGTAIDEKTLLELSALAFKYAIPAGIVLAVLYGGKKAIDSLFDEPKDQQGVAEGYQLDEGAVETITALAKKIPGIGKYYQMAQQYKPQLIEILKTSKSGKEVKQKMEQLAAGQSATVAESGMMKQLGGLAVGGGSILSTMWMNAMGMIDGVLAHAAAGEVGGAVASGSILGLIPVTLMLFAAMLMFKGSKQSSDEKAQAFQAQRGQQGMAEDAVSDFIARGGQIQQGKLHKPRKGETWQGSSHIGAAGGRGTKGTVSGKAANTNPKGGKPVVSAEGYNPEYDDEAGMADNNLETLQRAVEGIDDLIQSGDNLPEWCQEKIAVAKSMLVAVWDYMYSEEASDEVDPEVDEMFEAMQELVAEMAVKNRVSEDLVWEQFEAMPDNVLYETAAWRRKEGKSKKGGLNAKGVASYRRENPGSKLQMAVTTKPSKLKKGSKAAKRRKSFCARMSGVKGPMKKPNGKPTRKALALRKWNC